MRIQAYFEEWSVAPGDTVRMAISSDIPVLRAQLERITGGPGDPKAPRMPVESHRDVLDREVNVGVQATALGSYAELPVSVPAGGGMSVHTWFWATLPDLDREQVLWGLGDGALVLRLVAGRLALVGPGGSVSLDQPITAREWYSVVVAVDEQGVATVDLARTAGFSAVAHRWTASGSVGNPGGNGLRLATATVSPIGAPEQAYNGKLESPRIFGVALDEAARSAVHADALVSAPILAAWDFSKNLPSQTLSASNPGGSDGSLPRGGDRGVTGHNWTGRSDSFLEVPEQYGAVHFHDDEMIDANWEISLEFTIPDTMKSGVYRVLLEGDGHSDSYPLMVRGRPGSRADVLFLVPTHTYTAYANERLAEFDLSAVIAHTVVLVEDEKYLLATPEFGKSCYDVHTDGSPVRYSSRRRCIVNTRPGYHNWITDAFRHFPADMYTLEFIERSGLTYEVATDDDVDSQGIELFSRYRTVITGGHPEYWTWNGRAALDQYLNTGGRLMYLGGNGFYWVTSIDPERPWVLEVRRDNSGTRAWDAPYGERTHVYSNEPGGLWRLRGLGPNRLVGVGFASQGFSAARPFRRQPASYSGPASVWFDGIASDTIGDHGYVLAAAAGDEVDRFDITLGSPAYAQVLASADGFGNEYQLVIEDQVLTLPDQGGPYRKDAVKADMVYFPIEGGGAVFSGSSICYAGALAWNDFDNDLCTVTTRVLKSFCSELPTG